MFIFAIFIYFIVVAAAESQWNTSSSEYHVKAQPRGRGGCCRYKEDLLTFITLNWTKSTRSVSRCFMLLIGCSSEQNDQVLLKWFLSLSSMLTVGMSLLFPTVLDDKPLVFRQYYYSNDCMCDTALFRGMLDILVFIFCRVVPWNRDSPSAGLCVRCFFFYIMFLQHRATC